MPSLIDLIELKAENLYSRGELNKTNVIPVGEGLPA